MNQGPTHLEQLGAALWAAPVPASEDLAVPATSGLYAWWAVPGVIPGAEGTPAMSGSLELLYVGIASDLHKRIVARHLRGGAGASTLRRTLAALLSDQAFVTRWTTTRVTLTAESEQRLTEWMEQHLLVSWIEHPSPTDVERDLIALMQPPLNGDHNQHHPSHATVRKALSAWRASAGPAPRS